MSTTPEVTITATAHTGCEACDVSADAARDYVAAGGSRTAGKFASSQVDGGPHWATFTTEPAPALAEATTPVREVA